MRLRNVLVAACLTAAALVSPMLERLAAQDSTGIVISEFRFRGPNGINDEFVELFNGGLVPVDVSGWFIRVSTNLSPTAVTRVRIPLGTVIDRGCYYLVVNNTSVGGYSGPVPGDRTYTAGFADDGGVAVTRADLSIVDQVGHGLIGAFGEGTRLPVLLSDLDNLDRGIQRHRTANGWHIDTDDNALDFGEILPGNPQASSSTCLSELSINGSASPSPVTLGETVTIFATVTAGTLPASTGLQVTGDLAAIGGAANAVLVDDGVFPDVASNDDIFTTAVVVPSANPTGPQSLPLTVTDAQGRSVNTVLTLTVNAPLVISLPHDIQGPGAASPFPIGTAVIVRGVVTARKSDGFFLQTEAGMEDGDPNTSEGHFVFVRGGAPYEAQVGQLVQVYGSVAEFVPANDPASAPRTELNRVTSVMDLGASTIPAPYSLTPTEVSGAGALDQLERFEGMRVTVPSLTSITGTGGDKNEADITATSDGTFYAVITGQARPFRRAGVARGYPVLPCEVGPCRIRIFNGNPERLRVDSDALEDTAAVEVSSGAVMTDTVGPLDFAFRTYTLLPEVTLTPVGGRAMTPAPVARADQFTIASFNMGRFFDPAEETRLSKASLAIRTVLNNPDILGVQEVEYLAVLQQLAARIDTDALAGGGPAPEYAALLFEGPDPDGLDVGFLVKTAGGRVNVSSVEQAGTASVMLRAIIQGPATSLPQSVTVIVNDLQSRTDVENDSATGRNVRARRRAQAEFLATYIQDRQLNDPSEAIVSIGDYNAFGFNDGYVDTMGTILGTPAPADQVATASPDLVTPDLVNLADFIAESERYSSLDNGNAQALEHALVTANLVSQFAGFVHPRVNADFPESLRGDAATPQRLSDRDPAVAYFSFPPDVEAPRFSFAPEDQQVEATSPAGATVTYAVPTATDNLDGDVEVACDFVSGATLPLGNTVVICTAADAAGNDAPVSFSVTVEDTTAPIVTVPENITGQATSAAGRVVTFTALATDTVTSSLVVTCLPASGSTFPLDVTTVQCSTTDGAGNPAGASFTVTIGAPPAPAPSQPGHIYGAGTIGSVRSRTAFALEVRESTHHVDRGWIVVKVGSKYFAAGVSSAVFTNTPGFSSSNYPRSGNISVSFSGVGWWNGHPGYAFEAVAADLGERGRGRDTFTFVVRAPNGTVVANVTGTLTSGELRSQR